MPPSRSSVRCWSKASPGPERPCSRSRLPRVWAEWHIKSTTKALQGLYEYDAVSRLRDSQLGDERVRDIRNYIKRGKLAASHDGGREGTQVRERTAHRAGRPDCKLPT